MLDFNQLLAHVVETRGSDLHIKVGSPPHVRVDGRLEVAPFDAATPADTERIAFALMPKDRAEEFMAHSDADFAHSVSGVGRFRVSVYRQRGSIGLVLRRVMPGVPTIEGLGLPASIRVLGVDEVDEAFHARHSAKFKTYRYRIFRGEVCPPFLANYVYHHPYPLDVGKMMAAAKISCHD